MTKKLQRNKQLNYNINPEKVFKDDTLLSKTSPIKRKSNNNEKNSERSRTH